MVVKAFQKSFSYIGKIKILVKYMFGTTCVMIRFVVWTLKLRGFIKTIPKTTKNSFLK